MIDLSQYQNTKTILVFRSKEEFEEINPYFKNRFNNYYGNNFCINMNHVRGYETYSDLNYFKKNYGNYTFIEVSSLLNKNKIHELW